MTCFDDYCFANKSCKLVAIRKRNRELINCKMRFKATLNVDV